MGILEAFDFSNTLGYPRNFNQHRRIKSIVTFHKDEDTIATHVEKFKEFLMTWDIVDKDTIIQIFMMYLGMGGNQDIYAWYGALPLGVYFSFNSGWRYSVISGTKTSRRKS